MNLIASANYVQTPFPAAEVSGLRLAAPGEVAASGELSLSLPDGLGKLALAFERHYFEEVADEPDVDYNCHSFMATVKGWLPVGGSDPNICGWGASDLLNGDKYEIIDASDIKPGMAVGLTRAEDRYLIHSFVGIDGGRHIAVRTNRGKIVVADNVSTIAHYAAKHGCAILVHAMDVKPSVMGSDHWKQFKYDPTGINKRC